MSFYLGYLFDQSDNPDEFLSKCSEEERKTFFQKYSYEIKMRIDAKDDIGKMKSIGEAFARFGYENIWKRYEEGKNTCVEGSDRFRDHKAGYIRVTYAGMYCPKCGYKFKKRKWGFDYEDEE